MGPPFDDGDRLGYGTRMALKNPQTGDTLRVLGIDPGSRFTGYGVIEILGSRVNLITQGRISCPASMPLPQRLTVLATATDEVAREWKPDIAVLETPFQGINPRSLIVLAQTRGALLVTLARLGLQIEEYTPAEVKSAVTGNGRAGKDQVLRMVGILLSTSPADLTPDAADALAVALCYSARRPLIRARSRPLRSKA